jgi:orotidine-5'-phosphate decarboxylase
MFNVHASGGSSMLKATVAAVREEAAKKGIVAPKIIAVTILTSLDDSMLSKELGWNLPAQDAVQRLAKLTKDCGLDGVVASPQEAAQIRATCGKDFLIITPGVRPEWAAADDQARATTPAEAIQNGADFIVVGRPITKQANPAEAASRIVEEVASKL